MKKSARHKWAAALSLITLGLYPGGLTAHTTTIETNVATSASTGSQTVNEEGSISTGSASAAVEIDTTVNGQSTKSVVVEQESSTGRQQIEVTQTIQAKDNQAPAEFTEITVNGQPIAESATTSLTSPARLQPVPATVTEPSAPTFFEHIWSSLTRFFNKLISLLD